MEKPQIRSPMTVAFTSAERVSLENLINCWMREVQDYILLTNPLQVVFPLKTGGGTQEIIASLEYYSQLGASRLKDFLQLRSRINPERSHDLTLWELSSLLLQDLRERERQIGNKEENESDCSGSRSLALLMRIFQSQQVIAESLEAISNSADSCSDSAAASDYLASEQGLTFGHPFHPTPKSRLGWSDRERQLYSPEQKGRFQLHYFLIDRKLVKEISSLKETAADLLWKMLLEEMESSSELFIKIQKVQDEKIPFPLHPWQAKELLLREDIQKMISEELIVSLGTLGKAFYPTSSLRTLYHPDCPFMIKGSLEVEITNSKRINLYKELQRSQETIAFLRSPWGQELQQKFPELHLITDPASVAVEWQGKIIDELSIVLRENPFYQNKESAQNVWVMAYLCQNQHSHQKGEGPLWKIIAAIAKREGKSLQEVGGKWFEQFLHISLRPLMEIYYRYGYAFEAHQQNTLLQVDEKGYPQKFFYRDNQGCFHREGKHEELTKFLPGLGEETHSYGPDYLVEERLGYYFIINNVFTLINTLSYHGIADEDFYLQKLLKALESLIPLEEQAKCHFVDLLFNKPTLAYKANLMTRFHEMDELVGDPAHQSVYVNGPNPLWEKRKSGLSRVKYDWTWFHPKLGKMISFRKVDLERDLKLLHRWMNQSFVAEYWKLDQPEKELHQHFVKALADNHQNLYIGYIDGVPMSYWEQYWVKGDRLFHALPSHVAVTVSEHDQGLHLLLGEREYIGQGISLAIIESFCLFLFQDPRTQQIFGEPDHRNHRISRLGDEFGFFSHGVIDLPNKQANLITLSRKDFFGKRYGKA